MDLVTGQWCLTNALELTDRDNGGGLGIAADGVVMVTLHNAAFDGGWSWDVAEVEPSILQSLAHEFEPQCAQEGMVGCPVLERFTFSARLPGTTVLRLENRRWARFGFSEDSEPVGTFQVTVTIVAACD